MSRSVSGARSSSAELALHAANVGCTGGIPFMRKAYQLAVSTMIAGLVVACGTERGASFDTADQESDQSGLDFGSGRCLPDGRSADLTPKFGYKPVGQEPGDSGCATYGGHALVLGGSVNVLLAKLALNLASTGELPPDGGYQNATLLNLDAVNGGIVGVTAAAVTAGYDMLAASEAEIQGLHINLGVIDIDADVVKSRSEARCGSRSGYSAIANLRVNGLDVSITGEPNVHLVRGLVNVTINEQIESANSVRTNALHISVLGLADIVVAQSEASLVCSCEQPHAEPPSGEEWKSTQPSIEPRPKSNPWIGNLGAKCDARNVCSPGFYCAGPDAPLVK